MAGHQNSVRLFQALVHIAPMITGGRDTRRSMEAYSSSQRTRTTSVLSPTQTVLPESATYSGVTAHLFGNPVPSVRYLYTRSAHVWSVKQTVLGSLEGSNSTRLDSA